MTARPRPSRARSVEELQDRLARLFTASGYQAGLDFQTGPDDVLISTYPKCGTTWMQQILHGLRTGGDMDFEEITLVVPWLEAAADMGIDPQAAQKAGPRCFKTHLSWNRIPKGARYIHISRDPADALVSAYRFLEGWFFEPGTIDLETFSTESFLDGRRGETYWDFLLSWWERREAPDVLFLFFEDMKEDLEATIERVASFIDRPLDDALRETVLRQSSHGFMKAHERQFDDHPLRDARNASCGLPDDAGSTKVASGATGAGSRELGPAIRAALDERWRATVGRATGAMTYADLRAAFRADGPV